MSEHEPAVGRAAIVRLADVSGIDYEQDMNHMFGVDENCGSHHMTMHVVDLAPGGITRRHFHLNADAASFVVSGEATVRTWDENFDMTEAVVRPGDFIYTPRGVAHQFENHGTETQRMVVSYNSVGSGRATGKINIEPARDGADD